MSDQERCAACGSTRFVRVRLGGPDGFLRARIDAARHTLQSLMRERDAARHTLQSLMRERVRRTQEPEEPS